MILIVGDSWACGEWDGNGDDRGNISHGGLGQYLRDRGHQVINLGKGGGSNLESASRIADFLAQENGFVDQVQCVIVFQTEWTRDTVDFWNLNEFDQVGYDYAQYKHRLLARFYHRLSQTAAHARVPVHVIGGCSDTLWLDSWQQHYPGVSVACQSWINLMIYNTHRVDPAVLSRFGPETEPLVIHAKHKMNSENIQLLLQDLELAQQRNSQWSQLHQQGLLCADRTHPNRLAHKILFDYLILHIPKL